MRTLLWRVIGIGCEWGGARIVRSGLGMCSRLKKCRLAGGNACTGGEARAGGKCSRGWLRTGKQRCSDRASDGRSRSLSASEPTDGADPGVGAARAMTSVFGGAGRAIGPMGGETMAATAQARGRARPSSASNRNHPSEHDVAFDGRSGRFRASVGRVVAAACQQGARAR